MTLPSLTFAQLKSAMRERSQSGDAVAASSLANAMSALGQFMAQRGVPDDACVGSHFRASYYHAVADHVKALKEAKREGAYIRNRKALLKRWRALVLELDRAAAAQSASETPFQKALRELFDGGLPIKTVASRIGVPYATLKRWLRGSLPRLGTVCHVQRLERHFALAPGALTDLLPAGRGVARAGSSSAAEPLQIPYRRRLVEQIKLEYALKNPSPALTKQWTDLLAHKTSMTVPSGMKRQRRGRWSTTSRPVKPKAHVKWYESITFLGQSLFCPTASINWTLLAQYLGWLTLSVDFGGLGLPPDAAQSLTCLFNCDNLEAYVGWRINRSGGVHHGGIVKILKFISSVCHPVTGYLTQSRNRFPDHEDARDADAWATRCRLVYERVRYLTQEVEARGGMSRDPRAPVADILSLPNPLHAVTDAVARMDSARPSTGGKAEAIWARDKLIVKLLASNPLRAKNLKLLTIQPSPSGEPAQLRKVNGVWRIAIDKEDFKNLAGAAKDRVYDMPVRKEVWGDIETYLEVYRPLLASKSNPYLLTSSKSLDAPVPMQYMNRRFAAISKRYFSGCPGVGPHVMRHIVATTILKKHPNAWAAAAYVLHDQEETVRKNYAHLAGVDAARWLDEMMTESLAGL